MTEEKKLENTSKPIYDEEAVEKYKKQLEEYQNRPPISEDEYKKMIQSAIYYLADSQPFYGGLLQELTIKRDLQIPTAGITYNTKHQQYEVYINPYFFKSLTNAERIAVFHHEVLHFTNKHLFRLPFLDNQISNEEKRIYNIAGDMAINQFISDLPKGCVDVKEWKLDDGSPFPTFQSMENYHELIKKEHEKQQKKNDGAKKGKGEPSKGNVPEKMGSFQDFDQHFWDNLDEETKKQMLDEARKILKRTVEKTQYSHSNVPDSIKDLLQEIDTLITSINYKQILKNTIRKTVCNTDRESTWKRPNKRYGVYSPGSKLGALPNLSIYCDSSGSISHTEFNEFLNILSNFLRAGTRNCFLGLWHTSLYYKKRYKLHSELDKSVIESGGTDVNSTMEDIKKTKPNLAIIFTDLYFDYPDVQTDTEILWIVSKGGNKDHKFPKTQKVIYLDNLK